MRHRVMSVLCIWTIGHSFACGADHAVPHGRLRDASTRATTVVDAAWRGDRSRLTALLRAGVDVRLQRIEGVRQGGKLVWHGSFLYRQIGKCSGLFSGSQHT
jgi:hypothetical protein